MVGTDLYKFENLSECEDSQKESQHDSSELVVLGVIVDQEEHTELPGLESDHHALVVEGEEREERRIQNLCVRYTCLLAD